MASNRKLIVCGLMAVLLTAGNSQADIILQYDGPLLTNVFPSVGGIDFTTADRITGTVVFEDVASTQAKSIQLSTTVAGNPGFEFDIPDVLNPGLFNIVTNDFTFAGTDLVAWDLTIDGEAFGGIDGLETLSISSVAGDMATIDFLGAFQSDAFTFDTGQFSSAAVPEPSSAGLLCLVGVGYAIFRRRNKERAIGV
ncbi:MAG: PEP-CTERM sorting domain-containing protein [Fuerstiella sp.]